MIAGVLAFHARQRDRDPAGRRRQGTGRRACRSCSVRADRTVSNILPVTGAAGSNDGRPAARKIRPT